jgi:hypothetical protein
MLNEKKLDMNSNTNHKNMRIEKIYSPIHIQVHNDPTNRHYFSNESLN